MKSLYILAFTLLFSFSSIAQIQIGNDIDGETAFDYSGESVSLSSDGSIIAIGAIGSDDNGNNSGHVRIYQWLSGAWVQKGNDIDGETASDESGHSVSLSSDGSVVAIAAWHNGGNGYWSGHVRIYQWISESWVQIGKDIDGKAAGHLSGWKVSLSSDASIVAIGAKGSAATRTSQGYTRIYQFQSGDWVQLGKDIEGEAREDASGSSLSLSSDGRRLAIGAFGNDDNGINSGHTRIYQWLSGAWIQMGQDIDGEAAGDQNPGPGIDPYLGNSVALSSDGNVVAIGARFNDGNGSNSGHTRIYQWVSGAWSQMGKDIDGEAAGDESGSSVSLSSDGSIVAIGAFGNDGNGSNSGHTRLYQYQSGDWVQLGKDIDGEAAGDGSGKSVSLSSDGSIVAIGAHFNNHNGNNRTGHTRIYEICDNYSIKIHPRDVTMPIGETARMDLKSTYRWYQWQTDVGFGFVNLADIDQYKGVNNDTLEIMDLTIKNNNQPIRCIVSNYVCSDTSTVATLNVDGNLGIEDTENLFKVYPNPTSEELNITIAAKFIGSTYKILDPIGKKVIEGEINNTSSTIDVSVLSKGYYLLQIGDGSVSHKILIE